MSNAEFNETETETADIIASNIQEAFDAGVEAEKDEDSIKMDMIAAGATFKNVTRLYNQFLIDAGLAISAAERKEIVDSTLQGRDLSTEDALETAVADISAAIVGSTERSALALIRSYAKRNELEIFAKPKAQGGQRPSFASGYYDWLVNNPNATVDDATAYINGEGDFEDTSDNVKRHISHYMAIYNLAQKIHHA